MDLNFIEEEVPKIVRAGGSGREAERWEDHLSPLKEKPGKSFRVWTYEKKSAAVSRMTTVRNRLTKAVPHENWKLSVRAIPEGEGFGVYVSYEGTFTAEEVRENARKHQERSERVKAGRAATSAGEGESAAAPSAKERVQAAARKTAAA